MKKLILILLSVLMLLQAVACAKPNDIEESATTSGDVSVVSEETTAEVSNIPVKDYNCEFVLSDGNGDSYTDYFYAEEAFGDGLSDSLYERQLKIKDHIGVTLKWESAGEWTEYSQVIVNTVKSGDDHYQLLTTNVYQGVTDLIVKNALHDIGDCPSIEFERDYWAKDIMDDLKVGDSYYLGYSDWYLAFTHIFLFNKTIHSNKGIENLYDLVTNYEWTFDKMTEIASKASLDTDGDGWDKDDNYGLSGWGWTYLIDFVTASDLKIVDKDENGDFCIAYENNTEKLLNLFDKIYAMYTADYTYLWPAYFSDADTLSITSGQVLFQFVTNRDILSIRDCEIPLGILPYPLYDTNQKQYKSLSWNGYLAIPDSVKNIELTSDVAELLAFYADPVKEAYYEKLLGSKMADAPEDSQMLEIIWDSVCIDVGLLSSNSSSAMDSLVYMIPQQCAAKKPNITSFIKRYKTQAQKGLDKVFKPE